MKNTTLFLAILCLSFFIACDDEEQQQSKGADAKLNLMLDFNPDQDRLNNLGQPATIPLGNAAQTPEFHQMSVHYVELTSSPLTALGQGAVVYKGAETTAGGDNAVDFDKAAKAAPDQVFATYKISDIPPGTYEYVRASLTYQLYNIKFNIGKIPGVGSMDDIQGTLASFVGFNTYITEITPRKQTLKVNDDRKQGFWVMETDIVAPVSIPQLHTGQAPAGATTVVNPLFATSPIPAGSCVVTGKLDKPLVITGDEPDDRFIVLSFSTNKSFEWKDFNGNGKLDFYADQSTPNEQVVDMGVRGLIGFVK